MLILRGVATTTLRTSFRNVTACLDIRFATACLEMSFPVKAAMVSAIVFNDEEVPREPEESPATKTNGEIFLNCRFTNLDFSASSERTE